ncbi:uncharacterized protein MONBRDRAFT_33958 [Monosiga brevicollis MX1]|uniref:D-aminoacyl-tRNA deacylase n=1 Tax=Monosiga brevicollis TaxID=81824 RepID=A9V8R9_MONBE|nr:uncharacterized protein MONBRDRAFT_33958 [Monosiga brevicollis MX1]EDQ86008.1 predicted protein [Monosiga brevicollis MX1]|eukprot:XP_001749202.1 hypothetical protein [Monosiga brevicollis MX1]
MRQDTEEDVDYMVKKLVNIRLFEDEEGKMWRKSIKDLDLELLCVSQFTLYAKMKSNKPDFHMAAPGEFSRQIYEQVLGKLRQAHPRPAAIQEGQFGAMMAVDLVNDGPVTIELDSNARFPGYTSQHTQNPSTRRRYNLFLLLFARTHTPSLCVCACPARLRALNIIIIPSGALSSFMRASLGREQSAGSGLFLTMAFWKPGERRPGVKALEADRHDASGEDRTGFTYNAHQAYTLSQQRARLPVFEARERILYMLEKYQTLIVVGETGSGKSTQIPQYLHEAGWTADGRVVACLQPRRVAAVSVAQRVAEERGCHVGEEVGYAIRFEDACDELKTRIKFMTEGVLIREMMRDPLLKRYSVIMLDEAHERTIFLDVVVGLLYKIQKKRPDLKIIVSSATLDAEAFRNYFNRNLTGDSRQDTAGIITVEGRTYPVTVMFSETPVPDYLSATVSTILDIHSTMGAGDVLAFLTGQEEVDEAVRRLNAQFGDNRRAPHVLPMYGALPARDQLHVFAPAGDGRRKVIVATNIAEASITIPGIVYVVDCGFVKMRGYNPDTGIESLVVTPISQASANQRAGRAGRMRSGCVYRLYTEAGYRELRATTVPEMQRVDISNVILQLKALGIHNVLRFPYLSPPPAKTMVNALESLFALGAIDDQGRLTNPLGFQMAEFPLPPMLSRTLLASGECGCSEEITAIIAMLQVQHVFTSPPNKRQEAARRKQLFSCEEGDHLTLLNVFMGFERANYDGRWCYQNFLNQKNLLRAREICRQLRKSLRRFDIPLVSSEGDSDAILKCLVRGFFANSARLHMDGSYRSIRGDQKLEVHPGSVLHAEKQPAYVIFNEVLLTSANFMRDISGVEASWLSDLAPHYYAYGAERSAEPTAPSSMPAHDVLAGIFPPDVRS